MQMPESFLLPICRGNELGCVSVQLSELQPSWIVLGSLLYTPYGKFGKTQVGLVRENNRKRKGDVRRQRKREERWGGSRVEKSGAKHGRERG